MSNEYNEYKVKATYVGQRQFSDAKLAGTFLVGEDLKFFPHVKHAEIGREYWLQRKDKNFACGKHPEAVDELHLNNTTQIKRWRAQECKDVTEVRRIKHQRKMSKDEDLERLVQRLETFCEGLTYFEVRNVVEYLLSHIVFERKQK